MNNNNNTSLVSIDGSLGEGGGQILRTALTLSMITGIRFEIKKIRSKRSKPGLLRQHLTAVQAASAISQAQTRGAELGSQHLYFQPDSIQGGDYQFAIGSAGSCMLVLQTILPALWFANAPSTVQISGGTHNPSAPPADFLIQTWAPLMSRMGVQQNIELKRYGFYPAGGGLICAKTSPVQSLTALKLTERGALLNTNALVYICGLPGGIAPYQVKHIQSKMPHIEVTHTQLPNSHGPGNVALLTTQYEHVNLVFCGFGGKKLTAENVANSAMQQAQTYMENEAIADEYLADQILLPMALAGAGQYTACTLSSHFHTNAQIIQKFLPIEINTTEHQQGWLVEIIA